jgi:3-mercaptopyruvate sulfurtransferase SseA
MLSNAVDGPIHSWKSVADLQAMYASAGITPEMHVIPYCSTGVRSANTYLAMRVIGHDAVSLFSGSWAEWTAHPDLPVTKGDKP